MTLIKLYRTRGLNPVFDQRGELPPLPFGNPIGFVPASRGGVYIKLPLTAFGNSRKDKTQSTIPPLTSLSLFPVRFLARVESPVDRLEMSPIEVCIDLRRRDIGMSQHRLN